MGSSSSRKKKGEPVVFEQLAEPEGPVEPSAPPEPDGYEPSAPPPDDSDLLAFSSGEDESPPKRPRTPSPPPAPRRIVYNEGTAKELWMDRLQSLHVAGDASDIARLARQLDPIGRMNCMATLAQMNAAPEVAALLGKATEADEEFVKRGIQSYVRCGGGLPCYYFDDWHGAVDRPELIPPRQTRMCRNPATLDVVRVAVAFNWLRPNHLQQRGTATPPFAVLVPLCWAISSGADAVARVALEAAPDWRPPALLAAITRAGLEETALWLLEDPAVDPSPPGKTDMAMVGAIASENPRIVRALRSHRRWKHREQTEHAFAKCNSLEVAGALGDVMSPAMRAAWGARRGPTTNEYFASAIGDILYSVSTLRRLYEVADTDAKRMAIEAHPAWRPLTPPSPPSWRTEAIAAASRGDSEACRRAVVRVTDVDERLIEQLYDKAVGKSAPLARWLARHPLFRPVYVNGKTRELPAMTEDVVEDECVICMDATPAHHLPNCRHVCVCEGCLAENAILLCPLCRQ